jgi:hypothetical protein
MKDDCQPDRICCSRKCVLIAAGKISATDAIVIACAIGFPNAIVLTIDPLNLSDLADTQPVVLTIGV